MRRGLRVVVVLIVVSAAAGLGWIAGQRVKSPDQIAFETEPPAPSLITVEVQLTELSADVIVRADVGYDDPASLRLSGALGGLPPVLVVTAAPERGAEISEGSVAIEISGRPVFLLQGEIPVFRDLRPRAVGPDVLQLEEALARLGYLDAEPDQEWDLATETAVAAWYESRGYEPNGVSDDEQHRLDQARDRVDTAEDAVEAAGDRVDAARDQVETAEKGVETAEKGVETAEKGVQTAEKGVETALEGVEAAIRRRSAAGDAVSRAQDRLDEAREALVEAEQGPDELEIRRAESEVLSAEEQVRFAEADAESGAEEADRAIQEAEAARESAARAYSLAESRWQSAQTGVHPDGGTVPTAAQMEALRLAVRSAELGLEDAERGIEQARAARDRKAVEAGSALRAARDRLAIARDSLDDLLAPPDTSLQQRAVEDAELALDTARSDLEDARAAVDDAREGVEDARSAVDDALNGVEDARSAVDDAREGVEDARSAVDDALNGVEDARSDLAEAQDSLAELESETGTWIPAGELIFLERLPVRVDLLTAERGSSVSGAFMTVTGSDLAVRGSVAVRDVSLVKEGGEAWLDDALLPEPLAGEIRLVEDRPGTREVANDRHYLEIVADGIPDELIGKNVKVVLPVGGTGGEVLAVPAAALSATADGATRVEVEQPDGSTRFVEVEPGLAASGLVEVTPLDGHLREGDLVVVGLASDG